MLKHFSGGKMAIISAVLESKAGGSQVRPVWVTERCEEIWPPIVSEDAFPCGRRCVEAAHVSCFLSLQ